MPLRLAFMGTPEFSVRALQTLIDAGHDVVAVYTQPPRPKGRGHQVVKSPVHQAAEAAGIPVFTPLKLRDPVDQAAFAALNLDLAVVAAYGLILPPPILEAPVGGCLNIHASLLPRWRGAAPIQRSILAGDSESGVCLMRMEAGLDTGPVYSRAQVPITAETTAVSLHDALSAAGAELLGRDVVAIAHGRLAAVPQPEEGVTYAAKLTREDSLLEWSRDAAQLDRQVRALTPWPGTMFTLQGETIKVLEARPVEGQGTPGTVLDNTFTVACGTGALQLLKVQRPGRAAVTGAEAQRGLQLAVGASL